MERIFSNRQEVVGSLKPKLTRELENRKAGVLCIFDCILPKGLKSSPPAGLIDRWLILFVGLPIDPQAVQAWREWAMRLNATEIKFAVIEGGPVVGENVLEILNTQCSSWSFNPPASEPAAIVRASRVRMAPTAKDDASLLTMMFGSMGDLLTQLEVIAKRFRQACAKLEKSKLQSEVAKRLAADNPSEEDLKAFKTGLESQIDHFPKILLHGESGVGKTLIAAYLQGRAALSEDTARPLRVPIPEYLGKEDSFEYDLFGYAAGTYTGGRPSGSPGKLISHVGGVIFLDEIGEANLTIQSKLLAFLDDYRVGPRGWHGEKFHCPVLIVAATNKNLDEEVSNDRFKGDLLARFTDRLTIPPLRDRMVDIEFILDCLLQRESLNPGGYVTEIGDQALAAIRSRTFENGNFRELEDWFRSACARAIRERRPYLVAADVVEKSP